MTSESSAGVKKSTLEAVSAATTLAGNTGGEVVAILVGHGLDAAKDELAASGANKVVCVEAEHLANYSGDGYCKAAVEAIGNAGAAAVLMSHTAMGKDLAPRVAAALGTGLVSDATALHFEDGKIAATKPVYAGKAYVKCTSATQPFMATLRPNNFEANTSGSAAVESATPSFSAEESTPGSNHFPRRNTLPE